MAHETAPSPQSAMQTGWTLSADDRDQPAGRVFALSLERALARHRVREQQLRIERSPRSVHRYRVSLRKARSLLAAGRDVFPTEELDLLEALLHAQATSTSAARDLDVFVEYLDGLVDPLPPELSDGVDELRAVAAAHRDAARERVLESLDGEANAAMMRRWLAMASVYRLGGGEPGPLAMRPTGQVVDDAVWAAFTRTRRRARTALRSNDVSDWHRVRKSAKRLRYELATFSDLYPRDEMRPLRKGLRGLQEAFGELQDEVVRIDVLRSVAADASTDAALSAGALIDRQIALRPDAILRCEQRWKELDTKGRRKALKSALGQNSSAR